MCLKMFSSSCSPCEQMMKISSIYWFQFVRVYMFNLKISHVHYAKVGCYFSSHSSLYRGSYTDINRNVMGIYGKVYNFKEV